MKNTFKIDIAEDVPTLLKVERFQGVHLEISTSTENCAFLPAKRSTKNVLGKVGQKLPGGGSRGGGIVLGSDPVECTASSTGSVGSCVHVLEPCAWAPCLCPQGFPLTMTAHTCAYLHTLLVQVPF